MLIRVKRRHSLMEEEAKQIVSDQKDQDVAPDLQLQGKRIRSAECPICSGILYDPQMAVRCGHSICMPCYRRLVDKKCPFCCKNTNFRPNVMMRQFLEEVFPVEYEDQRVRHTPDGWIGVRKLLDPTLALTVSELSVDLTMRLLRRMERMLWSSPAITQELLERFCDISGSLYASVNSRDSIMYLPHHLVMQVVKGDREYNIFSQDEIPDFYLDLWDEDQE